MIGLMLSPDLHRSLLEALLRAVPFDGWTEQTLRRAATSVGVDDFTLHRLSPGGIEHWLDAFAATADDAMAASLHALPEEEIRRIPQKIRAGLLARLTWLEPYKEAERRAVAHALLSPVAALKRLHGTVDRIWRLAGDQSTDWNWYSKRLILAGVYTATLHYWLNDESENHAATAAFLDRRLADVHRIGGMVKRKKSA